MKKKLTVLVGILFAAGCETSDPGGVDVGGVDAAQAGGDASQGAVDASAPPMNSADIHSRAYWERKWVGSASGVTVQFEVTSFDFDERSKSGTIKGYASSVPCLERIGMTGAVFFDSETYPLKYPVAHFDSDGRLDGPQSTSLSFEGPLYPTGRIDGLASWFAFADPSVKACSKGKVPILLSPVE